MSGFNRQNRFTPSQSQATPHNGSAVVLRSMPPVNPTLPWLNHSTRATTMFTYTFNACGAPNTLVNYFSMTFPIQVESSHVVIAMVIDITETFKGLLNDLLYMFSDQNLHIIDLILGSANAYDLWNIRLTPSNIIPALRLALFGNIYLSCS